MSTLIPVQNSRRTISKSARDSCTMPKTFDFISINKPEDTNTKANRRAIRSKAAQSQTEHRVEKVTRQRTARRHTKFLFELRAIEVGDKVELVPSSDPLEREVPIGNHTWNEYWQLQETKFESSEHITLNHDSLATKRWSDVATAETEQEPPSCQSGNPYHYTAVYQSHNEYASNNSVSWSAPGSFQEDFNDLPLSNSSTFTPWPRSMDYMDNPLSADCSYLGAGSVDPFQSLPVPWKPFMPALIHHFFLFFAPAYPAEGNSWSRNSIRKNWWPLILSDSALCSATLLMLLGHKEHRSDRIISQTAHSSELWLKISCLKYIREALADDHDRASDGTIGAMLTLAAYEFLYSANFDLYHLHMQAVQDAVDLRGGIANLEADSSLTNYLYCSGHDLTIFVGGSPYFNHVVDEAWNRYQNVLSLSPQSSELVTPLPTAIEKLASNKFISSRQVELMRALCPMLGEGCLIDCNLLIEIESQLFDWNGGWVNAICPFHGFLEDIVVQQSDLTLRLTILGLLYQLMFSLGMVDDHYARRRAQTSSMCSTIEYAVLRNTVYGELLFWHLILSRSIEGNISSQDLVTVKFLAMEHGVNNWEDMKSFLTRFPYSPDLCDLGCETTWSYISYQILHSDGSTQEELTNMTSTVDSKSRYELPTAPEAFPKFFAEKETTS